MRSRRRSIPTPRYNDFVINHQSRNNALNVDHGGALLVGVAPTRGLVTADLMAQDGTEPTEIGVEQTVAAGNVDSLNYTSSTAVGSNGGHCADDNGNDKDEHATKCDTKVDKVGTTMFSPQADEDRPTKRKKQMPTIRTARGNLKDDDDEKYSSDASTDANKPELPHCNLNERIVITECITSEDASDESKDMNDGMALQAKHPIVLVIRTIIVMMITRMKMRMMTTTMIALEGRGMKKKPPFLRSSITLIAHLMMLTVLKQVKVLFPCLIAPW